MGKTSQQFKKEFNSSKTNQIVKVGSLKEDSIEEITGTGSAGAFVSRLTVFSDPKKLYKQKPAVRGGTIIEPNTEKHYEGVNSIKKFHKYKKMKNPLKLKPNKTISHELSEEINPVNNFSIDLKKNILEIANQTNKSVNEVTDIVLEQIKSLPVTYPFILDDFKDEDITNIEKQKPAEEDCGCGNHENEDDEDNYDEEISFQFDRSPRFKSPFNMHKTTPPIYAHEIRNSIDENGNITEYGKNIASRLKPFLENYIKEEKSGDSQKTFEKHMKDIRDGSKYANDGYDNLKGFKRQPKGKFTIFAKVEGSKEEVIIPKQMKQVDPPKYDQEYHEKDMFAFGNGGMESWLMDMDVKDEDKWYDSVIDDERVKAYGKDKRDAKRKNREQWYKRAAVPVTIVKERLENEYKKVVSRIINENKYELIDKSKKLEKMINKATKLQEQEEQQIPKFSEEEEAVFNKIIDKVNNVYTGANSYKGEWVLSSIDKEILGRFLSYLSNTWREDKTRIKQKTLLKSAQIFANKIMDSKNGFEEHKNLENLAHSNQADEFMSIVNKWLPAHISLSGTPKHSDDEVFEEQKQMKDENPCWDGYEMVGTKMKNGKEVPNCVPKKD